MCGIARAKVAPASKRKSHFEQSKAGATFQLASRVVKLGNAPQEGTAEEVAVAVAVAQSTRCFTQWLRGPRRPRHLPGTLAAGVCFSPKPPTPFAAEMGRSRYPIPGRPEPSDGRR